MKDSYYYTIIFCFWLGFADDIHKAVLLLLDAYIPRGRLSFFLSFFLSFLLGCKQDLIMFGIAVELILVQEAFENPSRGVIFHVYHVIHPFRLFSKGGQRCSFMLVLLCLLLSCIKSHVLQATYHLSWTTHNTRLD